tara:strand:- start:1962 stop:2267 length:306 start_codon:yes stop_codon:yes gene_type:complete
MGIRDFFRRPVVRAATTRIRTAARDVLLGDTSNTPSIAANPAAYAKLIAYAVAALAALFGRWWGVEIDAHLQQIVAELAIETVGGWLVWRVPNRAPPEAPE